MIIIVVGYCDPPCVHGECSPVSECICALGYQGRTCDVSGLPETNICPPRMYKYFSLYSIQLTASAMLIPAIWKAALTVRRALHVVKR